MSWQDRVRTEIVLTSPRGTEFRGKWAGDNPSVSKRLGEFNYPGIDGTRTQDLGIESWRYSIDFWFEGEDHDLVREQFRESIRERGPWEVVHPVEGELLLQPTSITTNIQPISDGNATRVSSQWIEQLEEDTPPSTQQLIGEMEANRADINDAANSQIAETARQANEREKLGLTGAVEAFTDRLSSIRDLASGVAEVQSQIDQSVSMLTDAIEQPVVDVLAVAGGIRNILETPMLVEQNIRSRFNALRNTFTGFIDSLEFSDDAESISSAAVAETVGAAVITAAGQAAATSTFETREEAVGAVGQVEEIFDTVLSRLDSVQEVFSDQDLTLKYFAHSQAFPALARQAALAAAYILRSSRDLAVERRFTLDRDRAPIEITIAEYGGLGEADANFDLFIESNSLMPDEIHLLPAGREVVVYLPRSA